MPVSSHVAKLFALIVTLYVPGINAVTEKNPWLSALVSRVSPVASLTTTTFAPGTRASVWSVAMPLNVAVSCCACAMEKANIMTGKTSQGIRLNHFDIDEALDVLVWFVNIYQASWSVCCSCFSNFWHTTHPDAPELAIARKPSR